MSIYLSRGLFIKLSMTSLLSCLVVSFMLSEVFEQLVLGAVGKGADTAAMFGTARTAAHSRFISSICKVMFGAWKD